MKIDQTCFIASGAQILGDVTLKKEVSVWFNTVIRGDMDKITIDEGTNLQDLVVVHTDFGAPTRVGKHCTIGHHAILHGCQIGDYSLIGMGSTILNHAKVGKFCIIGAGSLVTENKEIPDYSVAYGNPVKIVRQLTENEINHIKENAQHYVELAEKYLKKTIAHFTK